MKTFRIGKKKIGTLQPVFIIAEAGVNHNGSVVLAKKLVDAAYKTGADAVKFQNFKPEEVVTASTGMAQYQKRNTGKTQSQLEMIRKFALLPADFKVIAAHCKKRGIIFLSTPHGGFDSVDLLQQLTVPAYKIGSGDITNLPTLAYIAKYKKPVILATGMSTMSEIADAMRTIKKAGNTKVVVLQCTTDYPTKPTDVHLRAMVSIAERFKVPIGLSDHTIGSEAAVMAVALGASVIEKHMTLDKKMEGPDHRASADPVEFTELVKKIRTAEDMLGSSIKKPSQSEKGYISIVRKSLVARVTIKKGEIFTKENLAIKRPGTGLHPKYYDVFLGTKAKRTIQADTLLKKTDA